MLVWTYDAQNYIADLIISGDGNYIAMTDIDDMIYVFHRSSSIPLWNETHTSILSIDISFDGTFILTCGFEISLFNSSTSSPLWTYKPTMFMYTASLTSNGKYACVGARSWADLPTIYTFRTNCSDPIWNYTSTEDINSIDFSADGNYIIAGDFTGTLRLFNRNSAIPIFSYKLESKVEELCISDNGDYFAAGLYSGQIFFFKRGNSLPIWSYPTKEYLLSMEISADGNYLCASILYGAILLIDRSSPYIFGDRTMVNVILWSTLILIILSLASIPIFKKNKKL